MERILITGAMGQLGLEFIKFFSKQNVYVLATDIIKPKIKLSCDFLIADATNKSRIDDIVKQN